MITFALIVGAALAAPVFFMLGLAERDRAVRHERADIRPALRRSR